MVNLVTRWLFATAMLMRTSASTAALRIGHLAEVSNLRLGEVDRGAHVRRRQIAFGEELFDPQLIYDLADPADLQRLRGGP